MVVEENVVVHVDVATRAVLVFAVAAAVTRDAVLAVVVEREGVFHAFVHLHGAVVVAVGECAADGHVVALEAGEQGVAFFAVAGDGFGSALRGGGGFDGGFFRRLCRGGSTGFGAVAFSVVGRDKALDGVHMVAQEGGVFFG